MYRSISTKFTNPLVILIILLMQVFTVIGVAPAQAFVDYHKTTGTPPTVSTDSVETLHERRVNLTLSSLGSAASVSAYGVVHNTTGSPTIADTISSLGSTSATGTHDVGFDQMGLTPGVKYYVRAFATGDGTAYGSELVVYGPPGTFTTTAPANNATGVSIFPTLSWTASAAAINYEYCVAPTVNIMAYCVDNGAATGPHWLSTGTATSVKISGLLTGTEYAWAVRAVVGTPPSYRWGVDSGPVFFTTVPGYTVTYNGNGSDGGNVPVDENAYLTNDTVTVAGSGTMTRSGYVFSSWNTQADGAGTTYNPAATFSMGSANATLYAIWSNASAPTSVKSSFERYYPNLNIPAGWKQLRFSSTDGKNTDAKFGEFAVKITNTNGEIKVLKQKLLVSGGAKKDQITFSYWVKARPLPTDGICRAEVMLYSGLNLNEKHVLPCGETSGLAYTRKSITFTTKLAYNKAVIKFTFSKAFSWVLFDGVILAK